MDPEFLIGPMKGGREADPMGVFHLFECVFDAGLGAATEDDFLRGPVVVVGTENAFAEAGALGIAPGATMTYDVNRTPEAFRVLSAALSSQASNQGQKFDFKPASV